MQNSEFIYFSSRSGKHIKYMPSTILGGCQLEKVVSVFGFGRSKSHFWTLKMDTFGIFRSPKMGYGHHSHKYPQFPESLSLQKISSPTRVTSVKSLSKLVFFLFRICFLEKLFQIFSGCFDTSRSLIPLFVSEISPSGLFVTRRRNSVFQQLDA